MTKWAPGLPGVPLPPPLPGHPRRAPTPPLGALTLQAVERVHPIHPLVPPSLPPIANELTPVDGGYEALIRRIYESVRAIHTSSRAQAQTIESVSVRVDSLDDANRERAAAKARLVRVMAWGVIPVLTALVGSAMWVGGAVRDSMAAQNREQAAAVARAVAGELASQLAELRRQDLEQRAAIAAVDKELSAKIAARPLPRATDTVRRASTPPAPVHQDLERPNDYGF